MAGKTWNSWKAATIGLAVVITTAVITGFVVANWNGSAKEAASSTPVSADSSAPRVSPRAVVAARPTSAASQPQASGTARPPVSDVETCNQYAKSVTADRTADRTKDVLTKAVIGGALGAGVGAAGGAIAGGGRGAGKGAAIGGIVGATAGTLYGLNEANQKDARAVEAYRACMRERGHTQ